MTTVTATHDHTVGGLVPAQVLRPGSTAEVADALRDSRGSVIPVGARTKTSWAARPTSYDLALDLTGLDRIVEHVAGDLVVIAEAGVKLTDLQQALAGAAQQLALDPPEPAATLGGIVGANASGPRRLRYGTVRDLLIGVTVVLADGTVAHSGGKVVKNVAGYDLGKLYTGAHGSLGVVVSTTWRLHPLPPAAGAVVVGVRDAAQAGEFAQLLVRSTLTPSATELRAADGELTLVALFESIPESVEAQTTAAIALLGAGERADLPAWFGQRPAGELVVRLAYEPYALPRVLDALPGATLTASTGTGVAYAALPAGTDLAALRTTIAPYDGSVVVIAAPDPLPADRHWGPLPDSFGLMQRVKDRFDPERRLSPGRLLGGL